MKRFFVLLCLLCVFLTSCYPPNSVEKTGYYQAYFLAREVVPFAMDGYNDYKSLARVYLLESDSFGRDLFLYNQYSMMLNSPISIYLICQRVENGLAYYYSDLCYFIMPNDTEITQYALDEFKRSNDWNRDIIIDKCASIKYFSGIPDDSLDEELIIDAIKKHLKTDELRNIGYDDLETKDSKQIFLVHESSKNGNEETVHSLYLAIIDIENITVLASSEIPLDVFHEYSNINKIGEYIKQFKIDNEF